MGRLVAAEWVKLATIPAGWGMILAALLLSAVAVTGAVLSAESAGVLLATDQGVQRALHVTGTGSLLVLVLGIVVSAGEYRTQTATDTFLTTPARHRVLTAKVLLGLGVGAGFGVISATVAFGLGWVLYGVEGVEFPATSTIVWEILIGAVFYGALFAVLGVVIGFLVRNQILAITGALAWLLVAENLLITFEADLARWFPGGAGQAIVQTPQPGLLDPAPAAVLLLAYTTVIGTAGIVAARRRDA